MIFLKTPLKKDDEPEDNDPVYVIGMGLTSEGGQLADELMGVEVSVLSTAYCNQQFGQQLITEGMICAGYTPGGKDACQALGSSFFVTHLIDLSLTTQLNSFILFFC